MGGESCHPSAVGGFEGFRLIHTGHEVTIDVLRTHFDAIRYHGLRTLQEDGLRRIPGGNIVERLADAGSLFDLKIFAVRANGTLSDSEMLHPALAAESSVLTVQIAPPTHPAGSSVDSSASRSDPSPQSDRPRRRRATPAWETDAAYV